MSVWAGCSGSGFDDGTPFALGAAVFCVSPISASMSTSTSGSLVASLAVGWAGDGEDMSGAMEGRADGATDSCRTIVRRADVRGVVV